MPTIDPALQAVTASSTANLVLWEAIATGDTVNSYEPKAQEAAFATVQAIGTAWGGATITLQGSNDGTNWLTLKDTQGNNITFTADGYAEISTAFKYIRPLPSGGSSDDVDVLISFRG